MAEYRTRHERRSAKSRKKILAAAAQVFAERGYARASTKQIAEMADVAEGSLFYHFGNKRGILRALLDNLAELIIRTFLHELPEDIMLSRSGLERILRQRFAVARQHQPLFAAIAQELILDKELRQVYREKLVAPATAGIAARLQELIAAGKLRPLNVPVVTQAMMGAFLSILWFAPESLRDEQATEQIATGLADFFWYGLNGEGREK